MAPYLDAPPPPDPLSFEPPVQAAAAAAGISLVDLPRSSLLAAALEWPIDALIAQEGCAPKTYPPGWPIDALGRPAPSPNINSLVGALAGAPGGELRLTLGGDDGDGGTTAGIELYDGATPLADLSLHLEAVAVRGLDTFTAVDLLRPNNGGALTLTHAAALLRIGATAEFTLALTPRTAADGAVVSGGSALVERFNVTLHAEYPTLRASTLVGIDPAKVRALTVGAILGDMRCVAAPLFDLQLTALQASAAGLDAPALDGFVSDGISAVVTAITDALTAMYRRVAPRLPNLASTVGRSELERLVSSLVDDLARRSARRRRRPPPTRRRRTLTSAAWHPPPRCSTMWRGTTRLTGGLPRCRVPSTRRSPSISRSKTRSSAVSTRAPASPLPA